MAPPDMILSENRQKHWQVKRITRPTDVPDTGLICDLLWADPDKAELPEFLSTDN